MPITCTASGWAVNAKMNVPGAREASQTSYAAFLTVIPPKMR